MFNGFLLLRAKWRKSDRATSQSGSSGGGSASYDPSTRSQETNRPNSNFVSHQPQSNLVLAKSMPMNGNFVDHQPPAQATFQQPPQQTNTYYSTSINTNRYNDLVDFNFSYPHFLFNSSGVNGGAQFTELTSVQSTGPKPSSISLSSILASTGISGPSQSFTGEELKQIESDNSTIDISSVDGDDELEKEIDIITVDCLKEPGGSSSSNSSSSSSEKRKSPEHEVKGQELTELITSPNGNSRPTTSRIGQHYAAAAFEAQLPSLHRALFRSSLYGNCGKNSSAATAAAAAHPIMQTLAATLYHNANNVQFNRLASILNKSAAPHQPKAEKVPIELYNRFTYLPSSCDTYLPSFQYRPVDDPSSYPSKQRKEFNSTDKLYYPMSGDDRLPEAGNERKTEFNNEEAGTKNNQNNDDDDVHLIKSSIG